MHQPQPSYCESRLVKYGITDEWNAIKLDALVNQDGENKTVKRKHTIFKPVPAGSDSVGGADVSEGIEITYLNLQGRQIRFRKEGRKWEVLFRRYRLHPTRCSDDRKYTQEGKSGTHIHLNPEIIRKYQQGVKITTLFMVEGEFKHWLGYMHGLDIIGLQGISGYKEKDTDHLHDTLREIIRVCQVEDLVMIYDADIHHVKWEKWERDDHYDLGERANSFFGSARGIRDYAKKLVKDVYICHVNTEYLSRSIDGDTVKGLDDLFLYHKGREKEVVDELLKLRSSNNMFTFVNATADSSAKLREFFRLRRDKHNRPEQFYNLHRSRLEQKEFSFLGFRYKYNAINDELEALRHPDSHKFIRVACDYIKVISVPENIRGVRVMRRKLEPWKAGEITRDYVNKGFKNFFDTIKKYDQFTVLPDNTEKYKQIDENCYNLYYRVLHAPQEGPWTTIEGFMKHLFGEQLEMGYDYMTILYRIPWQPLPILSLVSEDRGTGKTKFLELLREIFNENATILGNDAITDIYNDDYASKLIIGIDEGLIERKVTVEKIKSWSTATRIKLSTKFKSRQEIPFFGKIVITSNNTDSFVQIEDKETRFWVREIKRPEVEDPHIISKMEKEIPAFLHFLANRKMAHEDKTRHWFEYNLLWTKALDNLMDNSKSWEQKEIENIMQEEFFKFRYHCICLTLTEITEVVNAGKTVAVKFRSHVIRKCLEKRLKVKHTTTVARTRSPFMDAEGKVTLRDRNPGRYWIFYIEQFLSDEEVRQIGYDPDQLREAHSGDGSGMELWPGQKVPTRPVQVEMTIYEQPGLPTITGNPNEEFPF